MKANFFQRRIMYKRTIEDIDDFTSQAEESNRPNMKQAYYFMARRVCSHYLHNNTYKEKKIREIMNDLERKMKDESP